MSKEMNKLISIVAKYDMISGLFMSLIIGLILNQQIALVFLLGLCVSTTNFTITVFETTMWLGKNSFMLIISRIARIFFILICVFPFIHKFELIASYLVGFMIHFIVLGYCIISKEGSGKAWKQ